MLQAYFGDSLDEYKRARFFLMRPVCHMFYAMVFMQMAVTCRPGGVWDTSMETPSLQKFHELLANGRDLLASGEGQLLYAKVWLNEALRHMTRTRLANAIRIVS